MDGGHRVSSVSSRGSVTNAPALCVTTQCKGKQPSTCNSQWRMRLDACVVLLAADEAAKASREWQCKRPDTRGPSNGESGLQEAGSHLSGGRISRRNSKQTGGPAGDGWRSAKNGFRPFSRAAGLPSAALPCGGGSRLRSAKAFFAARSVRPSFFGRQPEAPVRPGYQREAGGLASCEQD